MNTRRFPLGVAIIALSTSCLVHAQDEDEDVEVAEVMNVASVNPTLSDRVQFRMGPFFAKWDSAVNIQGQDYDLDERLGDSDTVLGVGGFVRLSRRLRISFGYWSSSREDSQVLNAATPVGPITLPPGTQFDLDYETSNARAGLGWAFVSTDTTEFGVDVGLSLVSIKNNLTGRLPNAPPIDIVSVDESEPMGTVGVFFQHAFSPKFSFAARAGYLGFDLGNIDGEIFDAEGRLEYRPLRNVGLGVAYTYDDADVNLKDDPTSRNIKYKTQGAFVYLVFGFGSIR